jgi:hypothetical protein
MRMITRSMVALGLLGTIAGGTTTPVLAQGVYFEGPGVGIGIGRPAYRERYYRGYHDYDGAYALFRQTLSSRPRGLRTPFLQVA